MKSLTVYFTMKSTGKVHDYVYVKGKAREYELLTASPLILPNHRDPRAQ